MTRALLLIGTLACSPPAPARSAPDVRALVATVPRQWGACGAVITGARELVTAAHCATASPALVVVDGRPWPVRVTVPDPTADVARLELPLAARARARIAAVRPGGPKLGELVWVEVPTGRGWAVVELVSLRWRAALLTWRALRGDSGGSAWSSDGELLCVLTGSSVPGERAFCEVPP